MGTLLANTIEFFTSSASDTHTVILLASLALYALTLIPKLASLALYALALIPKLASLALYTLALIPKLTSLALYTLALQLLTSVALLTLTFMVKTILTSFWAILTTFLLFLMAAIARLKYLHHLLTMRLGIEVIQLLMISMVLVLVPFAVSIVYSCCTFFLFLILILF